jgi:hypothetical protein
MATTIPENLLVRFVDKDLRKSTIVGDLAMMPYHDAVYGLKPDTATRFEVELARQFTWFQQSAKLLKKWRAIPFNVKSFR